MWEVQLKTVRDDFELSVVRRDYALGHSSWGWHEPDRKLPIASSGLINCSGRGTAEDLQRWAKMAKAIADALNASEAMTTSDERIAKALEFANLYGSIDGEHHKTWVIDQMVRALTGCPIRKFSGTDAHGQPYEVDSQCANDEYAMFVRDHCAGDEGPETYSWDIGIPP